MQRFAVATWRLKFPFQAHLPTHRCLQLNIPLALSRPPFSNFVQRASAFFLLIHHLALFWFSFHFNFSSSVTSTLFASVLFFGPHFSFIYHTRIFNAVVINFFSFFFSNQLIFILCFSFLLFLVCPLRPAFFRFYFVFPMIASRVWKTRPLNYHTGPIGIIVVAQWFLLLKRIEIKYKKKKSSKE